MAPLNQIIYQLNKKYLETIQSALLLVSCQFIFKGSSVRYSTKPALIFSQSCLQKGFLSPGGAPKSGGGCWTAPRSDFELSEYGGGGSSLIFLQIISDCECNQCNAPNCDDNTEYMYFYHKSISA